MKHIVCVGGTKHGKTFDYPEPLPASVVFQRLPEGITETYYRKPDTLQYVHADMIPARRES